MEKRVLMAVVLSLAVLVLYQSYFAPPPPKAPPAKREVSNAELPGSIKPDTSGDATQPVETPPAMAENTEPEAVPLEPTPEPEERTIQVIAREYSAVLDNRGAHISSWKLKNYAGKDGQPLEFIFPEKIHFFPGDLRIGQQDEFKDIMYHVDKEESVISLDPDNPRTTIRFQAMNPLGLKVEKSYTFNYNSIVVDYAVHLSNSGTQPCGGVAYVYLPDKILGDTASQKANRFSVSGPVMMQGMKREAIKLKKYNKLWVFPEPLQWIANEENYFFCGLVPMGTQGKGFLQPTELSEKKDKALKASVGFLFGSGPLYPGERRNAVYHLILAPRKYDLLKNLNIGIEGIVSFGFFSWLGKLFYAILISTTGVVKNYGLSIIILTIAIKLVLFPLSHISMKSMKKMQQIQPMMKDIQTRYKKDPRKQQEELTKLYRKYGVNPMSGCLPMIVQIPVFFALYQVLLNAIEMRGARFLWAHDLSQPDIPLVILMGASMLIQQKMTPTTGDPRQAKMMMFLPILFTAMFWTFPSGLVLYWLMNNVLTILQQYIMNRGQDDGPTEPRRKARTLRKLAEGVAGENGSEN